MRLWMFIRPQYVLLDKYTGTGLHRMLCGAAAELLLCSASVSFTSTTPTPIHVTCSSHDLYQANYEVAKWQNVYQNQGVAVGTQESICLAEDDILGEVRTSKNRIDCR